MRRKPRLFADQHDVRIRKLPARLANVTPRFAQQLDRVCSFERRITGREKRADVLEAGRAKYRVRQRVREHVTVGVARETARMVDAHATEHERQAVLQCMRIEPGADAVLAHTVTATTRSWPGRRPS